MLTHEQERKLFLEFLRAKQTLSHYPVHYDNAIVNYLQGEVRSMLFTNGYTVEECEQSKDIANELYKRWK